MRIAAGIILLGLGATGVINSLLFLWFELRSPVTFNPFAALSVVVLLVGAGIVGGGISAIRRKFVWWSLMAAACLVIFAIAATVFVLLMTRTPLIPGEDPASLAWRLRSSSPFWGICGIPGLLALIFLVKRREEFQT